MIFGLSVVFLTAILISFMVVGKTWSNTSTNFLFANRSLQTVTSGLAINSHWFWAIAIFLAPATAYNWGIAGLLWFCIPNALSLLVVATLVHRLRDNYPDGYSLTEYIRDNFSKRISLIYQLVLGGISLVGLLLAFTAINKFFGFAGLGDVIEPIYASLVVGLITLAFTVRGGIRTSIYTGIVQTVLWISFLAVTVGMMFASGDDIMSYGKNDLHTVFDEKFLSTFGIAFLINILVGASNHGGMWQKAFSMPKESIFPSFSIAAVLFLLMTLGIGSFGLYAQANSLTVSAADLSTLTAIMNLYGPTAIVVFGVLLIGQTSTVMDSCMTYMSSIVSREWFKREDTNYARAAMVVFFFLAWFVSWLKLEIWTIFMLMGALRMSMFVPMVFTIFKNKLNESLVFYMSLVAITICLYFSWTSRELKMPINDMYAALAGILIPLATCLVAIRINKKNELQ